MASGFAGRGTWPWGGYTDGQVGAPSLKEVLDAGEIFPSKNHAGSQVRAGVSLAWIVGKSQWSQTVAAQCAFSELGRFAPSRSVLAAGDFSILRSRVQHAGGAKAAIN
ncbi:hypothetical protein R1flu_028872 [Riccia fluitans]|uniref:Uncharacterized protein n=1 Tax=Riccia fluitans TaxID=41844 RepID=A0ABD1XMX5_9MARC